MVLTNKGLIVNQVNVTRHCITSVYIADCDMCLEKQTTGRQRQCVRWRGIEHRLWEVELDSAFVFSETILIIGTSYIW